MRPSHEFLHFLRGIVPNNTIAVYYGKGSQLLMVYTSGAMSNNFSTLHFFQEFRDGLRQINKQPLRLDALVVHKENFAQLADEDADDIGFAHIGIDFASSNSVLTFSVDFFRQGIHISIDSHDFVQIDYTSIANTPARAATKLLDLLVGLANGQVSTLYTHFEESERAQAIEVIYRKGKVRRVLLTIPLYERKGRRDNDQLTTSIHQNTYDFPQVTVDTNLLIAALPATDIPSFNRKLAAGPLTPLTHDEWRQTIEAQYDGKADAIIAKIDALAGAPSSTSFKALYLHYAEKRHPNTIIVLTLGVITLTIFGSTAASGWIVASILVLLLASIGALLLRHSSARYAVLRPLFFVAALTATSAFIQLAEPTLLYSIVLAMAVIETIECIILDIIGVPIA